MQYTYFAAQPEAVAVVPSWPSITAPPERQARAVGSELVTGPDPEQLRVLHRLLLPERDPELATQVLDGTPTSERVLLSVSGYLVRVLAVLSPGDAAKVAADWWEQTADLGRPGDADRYAAFLRDAGTVARRAAEIGGQVFVDGDAR